MPVVTSWAAHRSHPVRQAGPEDVGALVEVLARAFDDDPVPRWMFRGEQRRRRGLHAFFRIQLRHTYIDQGEVWTTLDRSGAAMWAPPARTRAGWRDVAHLVPMVPYLVGLGRDVGVAARMLAAVDSARPRQRHWYLATLGTDPDRQGTGVGTALLQAGLVRVDAEGLPAYLESSKESNIGFYARHGFEVTGAVDLPGGGPRMWPMWREPRP
jgi:ribosomal protein S18 acetylase RimI-like enzyme